MILFISRLGSTLPTLCRSIGIPDTGRSTQHQPHHEAPRTGGEDVSIENPPEPTSDDQRSKQFRPNPDGLSEPRIKWIG